MNLVTGFTSAAKQKQVLLLPDGTELSIAMEYKPQQFGWFFTNLTYGSFQINNMRIVVTSNMLRQFKNQIPFGLACFTNDNREPTLQQDFSSGRAQLLLLSSAEVQTFEEYLSGQISA